MALNIRFSSAAAACLALISCADSPYGGLSFQGSSACHEGLLFDIDKPEEVYPDLGSDLFYCSGTWFVEQRQNTECIGAGECLNNEDCRTGEMCLCPAIDNHEEPSFNAGPSTLHSAVCIPAACVYGGDCPDGQFCILSIGESGVESTFCASPEEQCFLSIDDCNTGEFCREIDSKSLCASPAPASEGG
jgi:hypothetical protein